MPDVPFHLAFAVADLAQTRTFYTEHLGCRVGRESASWIDFDFFGHQITAHLAPSAVRPVGTNAVDGDAVPVNHFGAVLPWRDWEALAARLAEGGVELGLGVSTGEVVVGNVGSATRLSYTALGHTTNLTARLCGKAEGGQTLTTPHTHRAALEVLPRYTGDVPVPRLSFKPRGTMSFKNVADPVGRGVGQSVSFRRSYLLP